jgi:hypothetical protein
MTGYLCLNRDGTVLCFGDVPGHRASETLAVDQSAVALALDPTGAGYWIATREGRVVATEAPDLVGPDGIPTSADLVDLVPVSTGHGLWALDAAGGVFCFGTASFHGSVPGLELANPVHAVAMAATPGDDGYWVLDRVGGVFCFGRAPYYGSVPERGGTTIPAVAFLPAHSGDGYTVVLEDGSSVAFGSARALSVAARHPIVAATHAVDGALLIDAKGIVYPTGAAPFLGTPVGRHPAGSVVDIAWHDDDQRISRNGRIGSKLGL